MGLPAPPVAYIPRQPEESWTAMSSPTDSPIGSRAPSPTRGRTLEYDATRSSSLWDQSNAPSRSSSQAPLVNSLIDVEQQHQERTKFTSDVRSTIPQRSGSLSKDPNTHRARRSNRQLSWLNVFTRWSKDETDDSAEARGRQGNAAHDNSSLKSLQSSKQPSKQRTVAKKQLAIAFAMISLVGMNDSATGANLESMKHFYNVSESKISLVFLANVAGYFVSSISTSFLMHHIGLVYSLWVACLVFASGCATLSQAPAFGLFIFALVMLGFGGGLLDACLTTVVSHDEDQVLLSALYACFGLGAFISPLLIGSFIDREIAWNKYYYVPLGLSLSLAVLAHVTFLQYKEPTEETTLSNVTHEVALHPIASHGSAPASAIVSHQPRNVATSLSVYTRFSRVLKMPVTWIGGVLIVLAFGSVDCLSAWLVSYQTQVRDSPQAASRYQLAGLWAGIAIGRVVLAWSLSHRLGERTFAIVLLLVAAICLGLCYAIKQYIANAVLLVIAGMWLGPVTPQVLSVVGARVSPTLKSTAMSVQIAVGLAGSALLPLCFGFAVDKGYLSSLPGVLIVSCGVAIAFWSIVPRNRRRED
ncbi:hypothetical protein OIO90_003633 [Microbotryomycetes sp. JL221]|nr:hypothetical protein OIO90_003633 [Microbotryomycetes sp. JL221]